MPGRTIARVLVAFFLAVPPFAACDREDARDVKEGVEDIQKQVDEESDRIENEIDKLDSDGKDD